MTDTQTSIFGGVDPHPEVASSSALQDQSCSAQGTLWDDGVEHGSAAKKANALPDDAPLKLQTSNNFLILNLSDLTTIIKYIFNI